MSTVSSEVGDVPTFFPHSNLIGKRRSAQENHTSLIEKDDLKVVNIKLQELSYQSIIKSELDEHGHEYLSLFSNSRAQKNETIVLFSNYDRLNLSSQVRSNLKTDGEKLKFMDLSTFDADASEMNLLFSATNRLRWLMMPIQGKFNINEIIFPKNIEGLFIYNQILSNDKIAAICNMNKLSHLIFWGCDLIDSKTNNPLPAGLKLQVEDLTLINPGAKLNHFLSP
jgi:hypothetical protein